MKKKDSSKNKKLQIENINLEKLEKRITELERKLERIEQPEKNLLYLQNIEIRKDKINTLTKFYPVIDKNRDVDPELRLRRLESTPTYFPKSEKEYYSMDLKNIVLITGSEKIENEPILKDGVLFIVHNKDAKEMIKDGIDIKRNDFISEWVKEHQNKLNIKWDEKRDAIYGSVIAVYENDKAPF